MSNTLEDAKKFYETKKFKEAYEIFYPLAANSRCDEAQYYLGLMYHDGDGVEKSQQEAMKWWKMARREGNQDAAYMYSEISVSTKNMF
ncbi:MAG: hypothetical protein U9N42_03645 [Campylobacterota bacterium]|nr:hypothetical protein [Campylobacterota bacterium]